MITCKNFNEQRLGNQLFIYASLLGIANKYNKELKLSSWSYSNYFTGNFPVSEMDEYDVSFTESCFHYSEIEGIRTFDKVNLRGYYQSQKYFSHCKELIKEQLTFKHDFIYEVKDKFANIVGENIFEEPDHQKPIIGIHIRRGDYVDNPNYYQLPITYYILALEEHFPNWEGKYNIIFFSDDIDYCKRHFGCLFNAYFSEGLSDIEDLCLLSQCDNLILSNSSYSWWSAYLSEAKKVIRPNHLFTGKLDKDNNDKDFWIEDWTCFEHEGKRIDLLDTTFTIPCTFDHNDRKENLELCINNLQKYFNTNIIVNENKTEKLNLFASIDYHYTNHKHFHRTRMLNFMAKEAKTNIIANWDADIFIPPMQLLKAIQHIRNGMDMVYPYAGKFGRINRLSWCESLKKNNDIGIVNKDIIGIFKDDATSVGGAVLFNKESFIKGGMENENFVSFGAEDLERYERFKKLGFKIVRVQGILYHLNHFVGTNSSKENPYFTWNEMEYIKVELMDKEQLEEYIKTWKWNKLT